MEKLRAEAYPLLVIEKNPDNRFLPAFTAQQGAFATRQASGKSLEALAKTMPNLIGGSADLYLNIEGLLAEIRSRRFHRIASRLERYKGIKSITARGRGLGLVSCFTG